MKFKIALLFSLLMFISFDVISAANVTFPNKIDDFILDGSSVRMDSHCDPYLGYDLCQEYWWAVYEGPNNRVVNVYLNDVSDGFSLYKQDLLKGTKVSIEKNVAYKDGGSITWIPADTKAMKGFSFNVVSTLEKDSIKSSRGTEFREDMKAKGKNPVTEYFISKYPSGLTDIKKEKINIPEFKAMKLEITSPKKKEEVVAGEVYEIKWKSKNLPKNSEILFQIMHSGGETSFGTPVKNTGSYLWNVPVEYAQSQSSKNAPYKIVGYVTGLGDEQLSDYSDFFSIVSSDSRKKGSLYPILLDTHTEGEVWEWGTSQTIQWRELHSVSSYTITLMEEGKTKGKVLKKIRANKEPFIIQHKWKIDKKTKPGRYYWHIQGLDSKKVVAETKSNIFEITK